MPKVPSEVETPAAQSDEDIKQEVATRKKSKKVDNRPVIYPTPMIRLCLSSGDSIATCDRETLLTNLRTSGIDVEELETVSDGTLRAVLKAVAKVSPAVTRSQMEELLGWETEDDYKARVKRETNDVVAASKLATAGFGDEFMLKDLGKRKVRCWNNTKNRPFELSHAMEIAQDILHSGPGLAKEKRRWQWNGESFIVGDRGQVISGQHRGAGLVLACQEWARDKDKWKHVWPTEPTLDLTVVFGVPELAHVIRTIDNVRPRSLGDVFYTSDLFNNLNPVEKKECSRMLMNAVDLLWTRTGTETKYQTHGESVDFLDRHPRLLRCVKDMFGENRDREISILKLSAGHCAALKYLFGSCESDRIKYIQTRTEKALDWTMWDKAHQFFVSLSAKLPVLAAVREVLGNLVSDDDGLGGRQVEKHAVLCKAWNLFSIGEPVTVESLTLPYGKDANGITRLLERPTVNGIDLGEGIKVPEEAGAPEPTEEEVEALKQQEKKKRAEDLSERAKQNARKK